MKKNIVIMGLLTAFILTGCQEEQASTYTYTNQSEPLETTDTAMGSIVDNIPTESAEEDDGEEIFFGENNDTETNETMLNAKIPSHNVFVKNLDSYKTYRNKTYSILPLNLSGVQGKTYLFYNEDDTYQDSPIFYNKAEGHDSTLFFTRTGYKNKDKEFALYIVNDNEGQLDWDNIGILLKTKDGNQEECGPNKTDIQEFSNVNGNYIGHGPFIYDGNVFILQDFQGNVITQENGENIVGRNIGLLCLTNPKYDYTTMRSEMSVYMKDKENGVYSDITNYGVQEYIDTDVTFEDYPEWKGISIGYKGTAMDVAAFEEKFGTFKEILPELFLKVNNSIFGT